MYKDHPRDQHSVVLIHRWSLYPGSITWNVYPWGVVRCGFIGRWSVYTGSFLEQVGLYSQSHVFSLPDVPGLVRGRYSSAGLLLRLPSSQHRQQQPATEGGHTGCHTKRYKLGRSDLRLEIGRLHKMQITSIVASILKPDKYSPPRNKLI